MCLARIKNGYELRIFHCCNQNHVYFNKQKNSVKYAYSFSITMQKFSHIRKKIDKDNVD